MTCTCVGFYTCCGEQTCIHSHAHPHWSTLSSCCFILQAPGRSCKKIPGHNQPVNQPGPRSRARPNSKLVLMVCKFGQMNKQLQRLMNASNTCFATRYRMLESCSCYRHPVTHTNVQVLVNLDGLSDFKTKLTASPDQTSVSEPPSSLDTSSWQCSCRRWWSMI